MKWDGNKFQEILAFVMQHWCRLHFNKIFHELIQELTGNDAISENFKRKWTVFPTQWGSFLEFEIGKCRCADATVNVFLWEQQSPRPHSTKFNHRMTRSTHLLRNDST